MRLRSLLCFIVLNIFLMLAVSVLYEYVNLSNRLQQLTNTVSTSVETAIDTSMASEELFTEAFSKYVTSKGGKLNNPDQYNVSSQIRYYNKDSEEIITGSAYVMAKYFEEHSGSFPRSQSEYNFYLNSVGEDTIYEWLFGEAGSSYKTLDWYRTNPRTYEASRDMENNRNVKPNSEFEAFVKGIGQNMTTQVPLKQKNGYTFNVVTQRVPTLAQMGLIFEGGIRNNYSTNTSRSDYNDAGSNDPMSDNFIMSKHVGKKENNSGIDSSRYYLTPYSLGVTYVPTQVLKPVVISHIQQSCLLNKIKSDIFQGSELTDSEKVVDAFNAGIGCIPTNVYPDGDGDPIEHASSMSASEKESIVNDGYVEYDLSTLQVKVDYKIVDFYDEDKYKDIVTRVLGSRASNGYEDTDSVLESTVNKLEESDTTTLNYGSYKKGNRMVARISVRVKVNIPYQSAILQWLDYLKGEGIREVSHYGIKLYDPDEGYMVEDSDGVWYQYTTYRAISR